MRNERVLGFWGVSLALLILMLYGSGAGRAEDAEEVEEVETASGNHFPYAASLRPQVEFWKKVFTSYSKFQVIIHDTENMKAYKVLDFQPLLDEAGLDEATVFQIKQDQTKIEIEHVRALLLKLHHCHPNCENLGAEEKKIWNLYRNVKDDNKFLRAAGEDRVRSQSGIKERFADAIRVSRRYLKAMEAIFRREGVPVELTRLPFVESSFNVQAYSKVGAAGIWQFMPSTGRSYNLRINHVVDERRDPLIASEAAAKFLKANYEKLGSWPLAITAYNHGPAGLATAVNTLNTTDIATIIKRYKGDRFGFASRNFYPEFLAAMIVEKNFAEHFGPLHTEAPLEHEDVTIGVPIPLRTAARFAHTDTDELILLNPAFSETVRNNRVPVPPHYNLRVPVGARSEFLNAYTPWQVEERVRLAALEKTRKARLAALRKTGHGRLLATRAKGKGSRHTLVASTKHKSSVHVARSDGKPRKRRS